MTAKESLARALVTHELIENETMLVSRCWGRGRDIESDLHQAFRQVWNSGRPYFNQSRKGPHYTALAIACACGAVDFGCVEEVETDALELMLTLPDRGLEISDCGGKMGGRYSAAATTSQSLRPCLKVCTY